MTSRPHDALFKAAFESPPAAAALLRELLPPALRDAITWETLASESGSFIAARLADHHTDLLFRARFRAGGDIVFLLEHQSTAAPAMPQRVLAYQLRIWERCRRERPRAHLPPVVAVVVSHAPGGWSAARRFEELFAPRVRAIPGLEPLVPRCEMIVLDLAQWTDAALQASALEPFQQLALWALRDSRAPRRLLAGFARWGPVLARAGLTRAGRDRLALLLEYLFRVIDPKYWNQLRARLRRLGRGTKDTTMTIADMLMQRGHARGLREGQARGRARGLREGQARGLREGQARGLREGQARGLREGQARGLREGQARGLREGQARGRVATLRELLRHKFGALDATAEARLRAASAAEIDRYLRRLLSADSLAAVFEGGARGRRRATPRPAMRRRRPSGRVSPG